MLGSNNALASIVNLKVVWSDEERIGPVKVDFKRLITLDTLISDPPRSVTSDLRLIGWLDQKLDLIRRLLRLGNN
jgi:hypothetical protein